MRKVIKSAAYALLTTGIIGPVYAQPETLEEPDTPDTQPQYENRDIDPPRGMEEVRVTGSFIRGIQQEDLASPLLSIGRSEITNTGASQIADIVNNLTINTGSENNTDAFTQNFTTGTSNINLRGLGVASTLVLLNGQRQTYSAFANDGGENFVDTASLVPLIAVDRVEILKDGAASIYGSDAVAGVANFITRKNFDGFELQLETQSGVDDQQNNFFSGLYGYQGDANSVLVAFSHTSRDGVGTDQRRLSTVADDTSRAGMPGTFLVPTRPSFPAFAGDPVQQGTLIGTWDAVFDADGAIPGLADYFEPLLGAPEVEDARQPAWADFDCTTLAAMDDTTLPPDTFPLGPCQFDFGSFFTIVPEEENNKLFVNSEHNFGGVKLSLEAGYAEFEAKRRASPSFPITTTPVVCGDGSLDAVLGSNCGALGAHPDNPYGVDVLFVGRIQGSGAEADITQFESETERLAASLSGDMTDTWDWTVDVTQSRNEYSVQQEDTLANEFQRALVGLGGEECTGEVGVDIFPGLGPCQYFNPFGSSLTGTGTPNTAEIFDYVTDNLRIDAESQLQTLGTVFSGELFNLPGGAANLATGIQMRNETLEYDYDENSNAENFLFTVGGPDFNAERDIKAAFGELALPVSEIVDLQFSLRYEDYEFAGDSTDPKAAILIRPTSNLSLRGSLTTSFRAPSLFQQNGIRITLEELDIPNIGAQFLPSQAQPNPQDTLEPEEADIINFGATWLSDSQNLRLGADYWWYDYENVIIQQNPQAVLDAAIAGDMQAASQIEYSVSGNPSRINVYYDNASSLQTDGIDLNASYEWLIGSSHMRVGGELTRVLTYDLVDPQAGSVDGLGSRNFTNFATSVPELRANLNFHWSTSRQSFNTYLRHIDSYMDDQNNAEIDSHTTLDMQYRYRFSPIGNASEGVSVSLGGINVTNEDPPHVATSGGYDSKVHDPRGRIYYLQLTVPL